MRKARNILRPGDEPDKPMSYEDRYQRKRILNKLKYNLNEQRKKDAENKQKQNLSDDLAALYLRALRNIHRNTYWTQQITTKFYR